MFSETSFGYDDGPGWWEGFTGAVELTALAPRWKALSKQVLLTP